VTGGSSGIGKCVAIEAAARGADVTLIARDVKKLESAVSEVAKHRLHHEKQKVQSISRKLVVTAVSLVIPPVSCQQLFCFSLHILKMLTASFVFYGR
jgi:short-subunit dehydrogenase